MSGFEQTETDPYDANTKQMTCAATGCIYNDGESGCNHEWVELDDQGECIFIKKE